MKFLTDTHTLVWAINTPELLGKKATAAIARGEVVASVVNLWELILKRPKKAALPADPVSWWQNRVIGGNISAVGIRSNHVLALATLPQMHGDPFDRIMLSQCLVEGAGFLSKDGELDGYGVPIIW